MMYETPLAIPPTRHDSVTPTAVAQVVPALVQPVLLPESGSPSPAVRVATWLFSSTITTFLLLPTVVLLSGAALVLVGQMGLRQSIESSLNERIVDRGSQVAGATVACLDKAEPLLRALQGHLLAHGDSDVAAFAALGRTLIRDRSGVAFLSWSRSDGTFMGVFTDGLGDHRLNASRIEKDGSTTRTLAKIGDDGRLSVYETRRDTGYDPRSRPFWQPAISGSGPVWTAPYTFFASGETGITCAQAVRDPTSGAVRGVMTVDFDLSTLSAFLRRLPATDTPGALACIFTADGTVVATSTKVTTNRGLHTLAQDTNPIIATFATALDHLPERGSTIATELPHGEMPHLAAIFPVQVPNGPLWFSGTTAPRAILAATAAKQLRTSLLVALGALALSVMVVFLLAAYLARLRRQTNQAQSAAHTANQKLVALGGYSLVKKLGSGGMGEVWEAEHHLLRRRAALKIAKHALLKNPESHEAKTIIARFEREAKATASLTSLHTVTLYDFGLTSDGSFYYAMELLDGLDLSQLVARHGAQSPGRVIHILLHMCDSLAEAHARGMIHRDIKPANIYLCRMGTEVDVVKVLDFGLVVGSGVDTTPLTDIGMVQGTPAYMAPEQARGETLDGRTDLYALGCVAYWLLTGKEVFTKKDALGLIMQHIHDAPAPVSEVAVQAIPAELNNLVMSLLAKQREHRPANADELSERLRALPLSAEAVWTREHARHWWRDSMIPVTVPATREATPPPLPSPAAITQTS